MVVGFLSNQKATMKTTIKSSTNCKKSHGFSLVEMLVVIAVIGIISAIAVPSVASVTSQAGKASHQRNAQMLATMSTNAIAAGNLEIVEAGTVDEVIDLLIAGVNGTGSFDGTLFQVHSLDTEERVAAVALLTWSGGSLVTSR